VPGWDGRFLGIILKEKPQKTNMEPKKHPFEKEKL